MPNKYEIAIWLSGQTSFAYMLYGTRINAPDKAIAGFNLIGLKEKEWV